MYIRQLNPESHNEATQRVWGWSSLRLA